MTKEEIINELKEQIEYHKQKWHTYEATGERDKRLKHFYILDTYEKVLALVEKGEMK